MFHSYLFLRSLIPQHVAEPEDEALRTVPTHVWDGPESGGLVCALEAVAHPGVLYVFCLSIYWLSGSLFITFVPLAGV